MPNSLQIIISSPTTHSPSLHDIESREVTHEEVRLMCGHFSMLDRLITQLLTETNKVGIRHTDTTPDTTEIRISRQFWSAFVAIPYENNPIVFLFYVYFNAITPILSFFFGPCPILLLFYCTSKIGPLFYLCFHHILSLFCCKIYYKQCILLLFFCTSWKIACKIACFNPILQTDWPKYVYFIAIFQNRLKNSMQNSLF